MRLILGRGELDRLYSVRGMYDRSSIIPQVENESCTQSGRGHP
jgi:hypothetical protein